MLLQPQRAEVIVGGGIVLLTVMETFGLDAVSVSESGILDGLAASALGAGCPRSP
jgi:exopolyphosphatase/guanosine-5'-triphosphate,3'-diphosphate pyrophosphatase